MAKHDNDRPSQDKQGEQKKSFYRRRKKPSNNRQDENKMKSGHGKQITSREELHQLKETRKKLSLYTMVALLIILGSAFFYVVRFFFTPVVLGVTFTILFYPFYKFFLKKVKNKNVASLIICTLLILIMFIPMYFIALMVIFQLQDVTGWISAYASNEMNTDLNNLVSWLETLPYYDMINQEKIDWIAMLEKPLSYITNFSSSVVNQTFSKIAALLANLFLILFSMFFFFRDGETLLKKIRYLSPLLPEYEDKLLERSASISRATIKGTVIIGLVQGIIGAATLAVFGIKGWFLWGVVMIILSIIPIVGSYFVLVPVAVYLIVNGSIWQGIVIIIIAIVVNYAVDYIMRPYLVGSESKVHDLIIFCSTLGGIAVFGVMGFIIGPFIAVLFVTILDIYGLEFKDQLSLDRKVFGTSSGGSVSRQVKDTKKGKAFWKSFTNLLKEIFAAKPKE